MFPSLLLIIKYNTNITISVCVENLPFFVISFSRYCLSTFKMQNDALMDLQLTYCIFIVCM